MSQHKQEQEQAQEEPPQVNFNLFPYYYDVIKWHELLKSDNPKDQLEGALGISHLSSRGSIIILILFSRNWFSSMEWW